MSSVILCFVCLFVYCFVVVLLLLFCLLFINYSNKPVGEIVYQPPVLVSPVLRMRLALLYACLAVCPSTKQVQVSSIGRN